MASTLFFSTTETKNRGDTIFLLILTIDLFKKREGEAQLHFPFVRRPLKVPPTRGRFHLLTRKERLRPACGLFIPFYRSPSYPTLIGRIFLGVYSQGQTAGIRTQFPSIRRRRRTCNPPLFPNLILYYSNITTCQVTKN